MYVCVCISIYLQAYGHRAAGRSQYAPATYASCSVPICLPHTPPHLTSEAKAHDIARVHAVMVRLWLLPPRRIPRQKPFVVRTPCVCVCVCVCVFVCVCV